MAKLMDNVIQVQVKSVYGNQRIYPMNRVAQQFADLLGTKTFPPATIAGLRDMGYTVEQVLSETII
jgi:hypothetical protein